MAKTIAQLKIELSAQKAALSQHMVIWNKAADDYEKGDITWEQYNEVDNVRCDYEDQIDLLEDLINS